MRKNNDYNSKVNLYKIVTDRIIKLLENQKLTWDKPWVSMSSDGQQAHNAFLKRTYSGINQILLSIKQVESGFPYSGWLTFKQINTLGGRVIKGQKSSAVFFYELLYFDKYKKRYNFNTVKNMSDDEKGKLKLKKRVILKYFNVFNIAQTTDLDLSFYKIGELPSLSNFEKDEKAEELIRSTNAHIIEWTSNEAFYNYVNDIICIPKREQFKGKEAYYETVLHELGHWTGHPLRLDRKLITTFASNDYAKEELVAELCSAFLCADLGFTKNISNNAAYIQEWINVLNKDHKYIFKAVKSAERAAGFIGSFQNKVKE